MFRYINKKRARLRLLGVLSRYFKGLVPNLDMIKEGRRTIKVSYKAGQNPVQQEGFRFGRTVGVLIGRIGN